MSGCAGVRPGAPVPVPVPKLADLYPRAFLYNAVRSGGAPYVLPDGTIDSAATAVASRYDVLCEEAARVGPLARAQQRIRELNPRQRRLDYSNAGRYYVCGAGWSGGEIPYGCDTTGQNAAWSRWVVVRRYDAVLHGLAGPYLGGGWVDFSRPGFAAAYAETVAAWTPSGNAFIDETCLDIVWTQALGDSIDYRRSGYRGLDAWRAAYAAGVATFYRELGSRVGGTVTGNCGPLGPSYANGWLLENFPYQGHASVSTYLSAETTYAVPRLNLLTAWARSGDPSDEYNRRRWRYVVGVACLGSGAGALTWSEEDNGRGWSPQFWYEELEPRGWLGLPTGPPEKTPAGWLRRFTGGEVHVNETAQDATFIRSR